MSNVNRISLNLPEELVASVKQHFADASEAVSQSLINLSPEESKALPKLGDKSYSFVTKTLEYMKVPGTPMPPYVNGEELYIDLKAYDTLRQILQSVMPLIDQLNDTMALSGSEAYIAALSFYNYIKGAAKSNVPGAQTIYDDLSSRFPGRPTKKAEKV